MKYCQHCGMQVPDDAVFCGACGGNLQANDAEGYQSGDTDFYQGNYGYTDQQEYQKNYEYRDQQSYPDQPQYQDSSSFQNQSYPVQEQNSGLKTAARIFMILGCISSGWCIIPLAWTIPMTVYVFRSFKEHRDIGIGFKVCTLLFVSLIGGILLLCINDENQGRY